jgi:hypothetical protein
MLSMSKKSVGESTLARAPEHDAGGLPPAAAALLAEKLAHLEAADQILLACQDGELTGDERTFLETVVGWDRDEIRRQIARAASARQLLREAGTAQQYAQAQRNLDAAAAAHREQRLALEEKLREIERQLDALEEAEARALERWEAMRAARRQLRSKAPPHVEARHKALHAAARREWKQRLHEDRERLKRIERMLDVDYTADVARATRGGEAQLRQGVARYCEALPEDHPAFPRPMREPAGEFTVSVEGWEEHRRELEEELAELRPHVQDPRSTNGSCPGGGG